MGLAGIVLLAVSLAMDAFAVAVCKGPCIGPQEQYKKFILPLLFGVFQMVMPIIGWLVGIQFASYIEAYDHWIGFILLAYLGGNMIYSALTDDGSDDDFCPFMSWKEMLMLSLATSIDALAVGITFAFLRVNVWQSSAIIGIITFIIALAGIYLGRQVGRLLKDRAEVIGGVVLILIGLKILLEGLNIISF